MYVEYPGRRSLLIRCWLDGRLFLPDVLLCAAVAFYLLFPLLHCLAKLHCSLDHRDLTVCGAFGTERACHKHIVIDDV